MPALICTMSTVTETPPKRYVNNHPSGDERYEVAYFINSALAKNSKLRKTGLENPSWIQSRNMSRGCHLDEMNLNNELILFEFIKVCQSKRNARRHGFHFAVSYLPYVTKTCAVNEAN